LPYIEKKLTEFVESIKEKEFGLER
jgi:hypothetical protein